MKQGRILAFSLALALAASSGPTESPRAQEGIDWSDPWSAFYNHPEILQAVFGHFGLSINTANNSGYEWEDGSEESACECCPTGDPNDAIWGIGHSQYMSFGHMDISYMDNLVGEDTQLVESSQYQFEGLEISYFVYRDECFTGNKFQIGFVDLIPGKDDESYGFTIFESCTDTRGDNMPAIREAMDYFLLTLKQHGFRTPADRSTTTLEPSPTPMVYIAAEDPEALAAEGAELTDEEMEQLLAYDPSQMDPTQLPAMAGAAAVGAAVGAVLMQLLASMSSAQPPPAQVYYSPATGKPVPLEQVQQEQALMDSGHVYRDGEWHAPKGEYVAGPSILSEEYIREKAARDVARQAQWAKEAEQRRKQNAAFDRLMELGHERLEAKQAWLRAEGQYYLVKGVEWAADIGFSVVARAAGPIAGPAAKQLYERLKQLAGGLSTMYFEGGEKAVENLLVDALTPKLPGLETEGAGLVQAIGEEFVNKAAEEGAKGIVENLVEGLPGQGVELITGTPRI